MSKDNKPLLLLLTGFVLYMMWGCHPNMKASKAPIDLRDALAGTYSCVRHSSISYPGFERDSIIGDTSIRVAISQRIDSALIINGVTFKYASADSSQYTYFNEDGGWNNFAYFGRANKKIWFENIVDYSMSNNDYYYYVGVKR
jgi:hypothetical protein